ncbi:MAG TPA: sugar ABC transporter substrate-binding protein [Devosiaceae bacterium]|nr:sugar ABC transporter substrate-binding protein [Devosiaceae bacterium]
MTKSADRDRARFEFNRRQFLGYSAAAGLAAGWLGSSAGVFADEKTGVDEATWTPDYINSIAGTIDVDTKAECAKVVPLDYKGKLTYWYVGPNQASTQIDKDLDVAFWKAFKETYPNIEVTFQNLDYNQMLDKARTAALGNAAPMLAKFPILWSVEFSAKGMLMPFGPQDVGMSNDDFWPGAMKSVTYQDKLYGIPTNNETMALIWNAAIFKEAGLDPETPPATWDDLVVYSKQIKDKTGKNGFGMVARANAGNTPFRFMPQLWAYGGGVLDEADPHPEYKTININNAGSKAALQASYNMYVRDKSVPTSALTNTQTENEDPFVAGQLAMMISHPTEYAYMIDRAKKATGADKQIADQVVANMRYGLIPKGPARRAVVFGGSSLHVFDKSVVDGGNVDIGAVKALAAFYCGPEWSTKMAWVSSNPGNLRGFRTKWMKQRLEQIKFLNVTTSMLPYGIPYPVIPESSEIMNIIVPGMLQNALTQKMSVADAAEDAAKKISDVLNGI